MSRCKFCMQRKYSGSLYKYWTDVSVDELIRAGVRVFWHMNWYEADRYGLGMRREDLEEPKWALARSGKELDMLDESMAERGGRFYERVLMIYFDIKDDRLWREVQAIEKANEEKEEAYWRWYRESGRADRDATERGWALMGADPAWYDRQTAPQALL